MNVSTDVFKWLQACSVARDGKKAQDNRIELAADTTELLRVGYLFGEIIKTACKNESNCKLWLMQTTKL